LVDKSKIRPAYQYDLKNSPIQNFLLVFINFIGFHRFKINFSIRDRSVFRVNYTFVPSLTRVAIDKADRSALPAVSKREEERYRSRWEKEGVKRACQGRRLSAPSWFTCDLDPSISQHRNHGPLISTSCALFLCVCTNASRPSTHSSEKQLRNRVAEQLLIGIVNDEAGEQGPWMGRRAERFRFLSSAGNDGGAL
jgi:hypothetical protein